MYSRNNVSVNACSIPAAPAHLRCAGSTHRLAAMYGARMSHRKAGPSRPSRVLAARIWAQLPFHTHICPCRPRSSEDRDAARGPPASRRSGAGLMRARGRGCSDGVWNEAPQEAGQGAPVPGGGGEGRAVGAPSSCGEGHRAQGDWREPFCGRQIGVAGVCTAAAAAAATATGHMTRAAQPARSSTRPGAATARSWSLSGPRLPPASRALSPRLCWPRWALVWGPPHGPRAREQGMLVV